MSLAKITFSVFKRDFILSILNFSTSIAIGRKLGLEALGIWAILRMIASYIEAFGRTKSDQALIYFIGKNKISIADALANINYILLINLSLLTFILSINKEYIYNIFLGNTNNNYINHFYLVLLSIPFSFILISYSYFFQAIEDYKTYNKIITIETLLHSIISITLIYLSSLELWSIIIAYFISPIFALIFALQKLPKNIFLKGKASINVSISLLKYAVEFYFNSIIVQFYRSGANFLATTFLIPQSVGLIAQAQKFGELVNKAITPVQTPLYPLITRSKVKNAIEKTVKVYRIIFLISFLITLGILIILRPLIIITYGKEFIPISYIFYILSPGLILESSTLVLRSYCNGIGKAIISSYVQLIPMIIQLVTAWFLIQSFGYIGAAISISIGMLLYGLIFLIWFINKNKINFKDLMPTLDDLYFLIGFIKNTIKI